MCDTMVALSNSTSDGSVLFAKNSDREPNEASMLVQYPSLDHEPGSRVKCTYIDIPQAVHTNAVLLAKPFWMWGTEIGANEFDVVIGNEAVFSKEPYGKEPGLIGMDYIRLALERTSSAQGAFELIIRLLNEYGQSGNCGFEHPLYYHNSFLIADSQEAWVLETAGKEWAAEKVRDIRSISNGYTIGETWDLASDNLVEHAITKGWCRNRTEFNFARCYSDFLYTRFSDGKKRQSCSTDILGKSKGKITIQTMMQALRYHGENSETYNPAQGILGSEVCMHAGFGPARGSQSAGSMISHIQKEGAVHWVTGTAAPCTSVFKPVWMDSGLPEMGSTPKGTYDPDSLYWMHEKFHRKVLQNYPGRISQFRSARDELEQGFIIESEKHKAGSAESRREFTSDCFSKAEMHLHEWETEIEKIPATSIPWHYKIAWNGFNKSANLPNT